MNLKKIVLALAVFSVISCQDELSTKQIDTIIKKYDTEDFSALKNTYVGYRGKDETANVMLMVAKFNLSCPPYIATIYPETDELIKADDHLIKESDKNCGAYFSKEQIQNCSKAFLKYDLKVIGVDANGNVYINPTEQELPNLLRKNPLANPKDIAEFTHYKGNWYVRKPE